MVGHYLKDEYKVKLNSFFVSDTNISRTNYIQIYISKINYNYNNKKVLNAKTIPKGAESIEYNDNIILKLNELRARIFNCKHINEEDYHNKIRQRYGKIPIYHIKDAYLQNLKTNYEHWIRLFQNELYPIFSGKLKGILGLLFKAPQEINDGKQPIIFIQNNIMFKKQIVGKVYKIGLIIKSFSHHIKLHGRIH